MAKDAGSAMNILDEHINREAVKISKREEVASALQAMKRRHTIVL